MGCIDYIVEIKTNVARDVSLNRRVSGNDYSAGFGGFLNSCIDVAIRSQSPMGMYGASLCLVERLEAESGKGAGHKVDFPNALETAKLVYKVCESGDEIAIENLRRYAMQLVSS